MVVELTICKLLCWFLLLSIFPPHLLTCVMKCTTRQYFRQYFLQHTTHMEFTIFITILIFFSQQNLQNTERLPKNLSKYWRILFVSCLLFHLQGLIRSIQHLKCLLFLLNIKLQEPTLANALSTGQFLASLSLSNFLDKVYWIIF